jgi:hypothetical protein
LNAQKSTGHDDHVLFLLVCERRKRLSLAVQQRSELVTVDDYAFLTFLTELARHHFYWHPDVGLTAIQVRQLGCHQRSFLQLDESHSIGGILFVAFWSLIDSRIGIDLTASFEGVRLIGWLLALGTEVAGWEQSGSTALANLAHQAMSLSLRPPIAWSFHGLDPQLDQIYNLGQPLSMDLWSLGEEGIDSIVEIRSERPQS